MKKGLRVLEEESSGFMGLRSQGCAWTDLKVFISIIEESNGKERGA